MVKLPSVDLVLDKPLSVQRVHFSGCGNVDGYSMCSSASQIKGQKASETYYVSMASEFSVILTYIVEIYLSQKNGNLKSNLNTLKAFAYYVMLSPDNFIWSGCQ